MKKVSKLEKMKKAMEKREKVVNGANHVEKGGLSRKDEYRRIQRLYHVEKGAENKAKRKGGQFESDLGEKKN